MAKIRKKKNGNYETRIVIGHKPDGRPIQKRLTHFDRSELKRMAAELQAEPLNIIHRVTVAQMIDAFLAAKKPVLSPSTNRVYNSYADELKSKYGRFCAFYADAITARNTQEIVNDLISTGKAPKTVKNYYAFLTAVFNTAGYRLPPASLPQQVPPLVTIPEPEQVKDILTAAAGTRLEIPLALASMGLRRSEICALSISDLVGDSIHIHAAVIQGEKGTLITKATKNYTSDRFVLLPEPLADKIREQGEIWNNTPAALSCAFSKFLQRNGFKHCRLHDLRHFFASYCHNVLLMSDRQIMAITGHKTADTLRRVYIHTLDQNAANKAVADNMAAFIPQ